MIAALASLLAAAALLWLGAGALLWTEQERLLFPAPGGIERDALDQAARELGVETLDLRAADGTSLYGWYRAAGGTRAVLYFHGNAETVAGSGALMRRANQLGWDFGVVAYRGYPGSEGAPGEAGIALDARALFDHTVQRGIPAERVVLHGRSLGGAVAGALAAEVEPGGVVLESTFTRLADVAREAFPLWPVDGLLRHPFDTWSRLDRMPRHLLHVHGALDQVVPVHHGRSLAARTGAPYREVPGGRHDDSHVLSDPEARALWEQLLREVAPDDDLAGRAP